jgi:hypothetical protein
MSAPWHEDGFGQPTAIDDTELVDRLMKVAESCQFTFGAEDSAIRILALTECIARLLILHLDPVTAEFCVPGITQRLLARIDVAKTNAGDGEFLN